MIPNSIIGLSGVPYLIVVVFLIIGIGFIIGRIKIKGISLGTSGVFIVALLFGMFFYKALADKLGSNIGSLLKVVENLGLVLFVTSVGYIAGPGFFGNMRKKLGSYLLIGVLIVATGGIVAAICIFVGRSTGETDSDRFTAMIAGVLSGALTSTPAFSVAKEAVGTAYEDAVSAGYGIAYLFGVIGVVGFVQIIPRLEKADIAEERKKITKILEAAKHKGGSISVDPVGLFPMAIAIGLGVIIGAIKIPLSEKGYEGAAFSLTSTGGCLLVSLILGYLGHIGKIKLRPEVQTLTTFRETGLVFFLAGAGIAGGSVFLSNFKAAYFFYGVFITVLPMVSGYLFAKKVLKMELLNNLGSVTGGMTSTPALGTLISTSGTDEVASAYAVVYPVALVTITIIEQLLIMLF